MWYYGFMDYMNVPPLKVAIVNAKGGVGKTATSILLGKAATAAGLSCVVLDSDPQGSATEWWYQASQRKDALPFPVEAASRATIKFPRSEQLAIIDTPPGDSATIKAACEVADYVIVPTLPSPDDFGKAWEVVNALGDKPYRVLLTMAETNTNLYRSLIELMENSGIRYFDTPIKKTVEVRNQFGRNPVSTFNYGFILDQVLKEVSQHE